MPFCQGTKHNSWLFSSDYDNKSVAHYASRYHTPQRSFRETARAENRLLIGQKYLLDTASSGSYDESHNRS